MSAVRPLTKEGKPVKPFSVIKPILSTLCAMLITCSVVFAQTGTKDLVFLKNGSIIKGYVLEQIPDKTVKIQTSDGTIYVFQMSEVERIIKETGIPETTQSNALPQEQPEALRGLTIVGGLLLPTGNFAATSGDNAGFAKMGFTVGAEYSGITQRSLYYAPGISYFSNPVDENAMRSSGGVISDVSMKVTSWTAVVPSVALGYGSPSGSMRPFFAGLLGLGFCSSPEVSMSYYGISVTQNSASATALAYGAVAGVKTTKSFNLFVRFMTMKPRFKVNASGGGTSVSGEFEQTISTFHIVAGISL